MDEFSPGDEVTYRRENIQHWKGILLYRHMKDEKKYKTMSRVWIVKWEEAGIGEELESNLIKR